jgi:hypothetical protein
LPHQDYASKDFYQLCKAGKLNSIISTLSLAPVRSPKSFGLLAVQSFLAEEKGNFTDQKVSPIPISSPEKNLN